MTIYFDLEELLLLLQEDSDIKYRKTLYSKEDTSIECEFYKQNGLYYATLEYKHNDRFKRFVIFANEQIEDLNDGINDITETKLKVLNDKNLFDDFRICANSNNVVLDGAEIINQAHTILERFNADNFKRCEESYTINGSLYYSICISRPNENNGVMLQIYFTDTSVPGKTKNLSNLLFTFIEGLNVSEIKVNMDNVLLEKIVNIKNYQYKLGNGDVANISSNL